MDRTGHLGKRKKIDKGTREMLRKTLTAPLANWRTLSLWDPPEKIYVVAIAH